MLICLIILIILISVLWYKFYKFQQQLIEMNKEMVEFKKLETTKREVGWDSIWKIVNQHLPPKN